MKNTSCSFIWILTILFCRPIESRAQWLQTSGPCGGNVQCFVEKDDCLFAGTYDGGVFLSMDNGQNWTVANTGLTCARILALAVVGSNLFAGSEEGVFVSADNGQNWTPANNGLTTLHVTSLFLYGSYLFAGTYGGSVFRSINNGQSWTAVNTGMTSIHMTSFAAIGANFFAGGDGGVFVTNDNGQNWKPVNNNLTNLSVTTLAVDKSILYAGTYGGGVFLTTNSGISWTEANTDLENPYIYSLLVREGFLFAGTNNGAFVSVNNGGTWAPANTGLTNPNVNVLWSFGTKIFAGTLDGVFISEDDGRSWSDAKEGMTNTSIRGIALSGTNLFAGTWGGGVYHSSDQGRTWTPVNTGLTSPYINALAVRGTSLFAATNEDGVFLSDNNGQTWTPVNTGLTNKKVYALAIKGSELFVGTFGGGVFRCSDGQTWIAANNGLTTPQIVALAFHGDKLFAGTFAPGGGVFVSENNGQSWIPASNGLTNVYVRDLVVSGSFLFAGTYGGLFRSEDDGETWTSFNNGLTSTTIHSVTAVGSHVFCGTYHGGVFLTDNDGDTWNSVSVDIFNTTTIFRLTAGGTQLYAGTAGGGVWRRPLSEMITLVSDDLLVTHTGDSGPGSLRQALTDANEHAGADTIRFAIPESDPQYNNGVFSIFSLGELTRITDGNLVIDGFSQAQFMGTDANPFGPEIEINGSLAGDVNGLWIGAPNVEVYGLTFNRFRYAGVVIQDGDNGRISGCYIGTDAQGTKAAGNGDCGIYFYGNTQTFRIDPLEGMLPGNLISGNAASGILLNQTCSRIRVSGNTIGLDRTGSAAIGNGFLGINVASGCDANEINGNVIAGNGMDGLYFFESHNNTVSNNFIGTNQDFASGLGNAGDGIRLAYSADNLVSGNLIWNNGADGVRLEGESAVHNRITQNSIWHNTDKGIDNTFGANEGILPPRFMEVRPSAVAGVAVSGQTVELFTDDAGQGKIHLGSMEVNDSREFYFSLAGQELLSHLTATAIDADGNTSDFSQAVSITKVEKDQGIPKEFSLSQNYPNPFNPSTRIRFDLPRSCHVVLTVYNVMGHEICTLVDGQYPAGSHTVTWNGHNDSGVQTPNGVYIFKILAGNFSGTQKSALIK
jgi:parallel beta-helix repeat protein